MSLVEDPGWSYHWHKCTVARHEQLLGCGCHGHAQLAKKKLRDARVARLSFRDIFQGEPTVLRPASLTSAMHGFAGPMARTTLLVQALQDIQLDILCIITPCNRS